VSTLFAAAQHVQAPTIDYKELSPLLALAGGSVIVLMVGLLGSRFVRTVIVPVLTAIVLLTAIGLTIWIWDPGTATRSWRARSEWTRSRSACRCSSTWRGS
jgi:hypothetical protein